MATATRRKPRSAVGEATQDVQADLAALREDLGTLAEEVATLMSSTGDQALDEVKDRIRRIRANFEDLVSDAGTRGRDALRDVGDNVTSAVEESLRERPLTTVALAIGLGFLFGATWRR